MYTDSMLEALWEQLEDVLFVEAHDYYNSSEYAGDITLVLASSWNDFSAGTPVESIWEWFDSRHSKGLYALYEKGER